MATSLCLAASSTTTRPRRFIQTAYDYGWVRTLQWSEWRATERGRYLMQNPKAMAEANEDDLACVITTCLRADRFCDGYLAEAFEAGLITRVVGRAEQLLATLSSRFGC
jgi:hypothetical protein